ncbi:MAG: cytochrome c [Candidatus Marinimicrobia bacterium]|nr:cytochrome c [Candidatus Neomarinimicrobiota bacterium]
MKPRFLAVLFLIMPLLLIARSDLTSTADSETGKGNPVAGQKIYMATCFACHGVDGKGVLPGSPNFTKAKGPMEAPDSVLVSHVVNGFQSPGALIPMPPKGGNIDLSEQNILDAIAYIRSEFNQKHK